MVLSPADHHRHLFEGGVGKLYDRNTPITAADLLKDPGGGRFFDKHGIGVSLILTDRGTEYCETPEQHRYEVHLAVENIDHSRTKTKRPAGNRHSRALPQDRARRVLQGGPGKRIYKTMGTLLANLNSGETASGKRVLRQDADADLLDTLPIAREKLIQALLLQITRSGAAVTLEVSPSA